jgi:hypothetical protein
VILGAKQVERWQENKRNSNFSIHHSAICYLSDRLTGDRFYIIDSISYHPAKIGK